jgi:predicted DNA-binding transcriptional regulator AlpA
VIEKLLAAEQVAKRLCMSVGWVRDHARGAYPQITCVKLGSRLRFKESDLEEFIKRCRKEAEKRGWAA